MISLWIAPHVAMIGGLLLGALLVTHIIRQRGSPSAAIAWLLVIVLVPYVGVPLYLLLGGRKTRRTASRKTRIQLQQAGLKSALLAPPERLLLGDEIPPATAANRLTLHATGEEIYSSLVRLIESATRDIFICVFILKSDAVGRDIVSRLARKASEGVRVRLLLDSVGSFHTPRRALRPIAKAGGRYSFFLPVFRRPLGSHYNLRNHRKTVIVDGRCVFAGGANIADEYMGPQPAAGRWHDLTFTLEGPAVAHCLDLFRFDWRFATGEWIHAQPAQSPATGSGPSGAKIQVVPSGPDVRGDPLYDVLLMQAFSALRRIWFVTPYFVPDEALLRALILAIRRGVDVRILVPSRSNHLLADFAGRSYLHEIRDAGGAVLEFPAMNHAKAVLVDSDLAVLGSANADIRSLLLNYEMGILVYSEGEIRAIETWMQSLMSQARPQVRRTRPIVQIGEGLARLLASQL